MADDPFVAHDIVSAEILEIKQERSLAAYVWRYEPDPAALGKPQTMSKSPASIALSKDLKKRGWSFVGPTTIYAFMQAVGLINDHAETCVIRREVEKMRLGFKPPSQR